MQFQPDFYVFLFAIARSLVHINFIFGFIVIICYNEFPVFCFPVYALGKLMNVKEDNSQLSAIARYFFSLWLQICKVLLLGVDICIFVIYCSTYGNHPYMQARIRQCLSQLIWGICEVDNGKSKFFFSILKELCYLKIHL